MGWGKEGGIQYYLLEDGCFSNPRKHRVGQILCLVMWHTCLRQPPFVAHHVGNGKVQLYEIPLGGVGWDEVIIGVWVRWSGNYPNPLCETGGEHRN